METISNIRFIGFTAVGFVTTWLGTKIHLGLTIVGVVMLILAFIVFVFLEIIEPLEKKKQQKRDAETREHGARLRKEKALRRKKKNQEIQSASNLCFIEMVNGVGRLTI